MDKKQYIENKEIESYSIVERKTYFGNEIVKVKFTDNSEKEIPKDIFDKIVSDTVSDASTVQNKIAEFIADKIIELFINYEIKIVDIDYIFNTTVKLLNAAVEKADEKL